MTSLMRFLEKKFHGRGIPNLPLILVVVYAIGYTLEIATGSMMGLFGPMSYLTLNPNLVLKGQIWRLVTWILIPPQESNIFFAIILLMVTYNIARQLEATWGSFYFSYYVISGIVYTIISAFVCYALITFVPYFTQFQDIRFLIGNSAHSGRDFYFALVSNCFSTYYIYFSLLLAFTVSYPDVRFMLYFIIPVKGKYLGIFYGIYILYSIVKAYTSTGIPGYGIIYTIVVLASLLNFLLFFAATKNLKGSVKRAKRRREFAAKMEPSMKSISKHKCAICGRTGEEYPYLEFRFCSKCEGAYEYCNDHLFTHNHITRN